MRMSRLTNPSELNFWLPFCSNPETIFKSYCLQFTSPGKLFPLDHLLRIITLNEEWQGEVGDEISDVGMAIVTPRLRVQDWPGQKQHLLMCCIGFNRIFFTWLMQKFGWIFVVLVQLYTWEWEIRYETLVEIPRIDFYTCKCSKPFLLGVDVYYNWLWSFL